MRTNFYIASVILTFILFCPDVTGSPIKRKNWNRILDRYEMLCNECIDMKHRVDAGEKISTKDLSKLFNSLGEIRNELRNGGDSMTPGQIARFDSIRDRYNAVLGSRPVGTTASEDVAASREIIANGESTISEKNSANGETVPSPESASKRTEMSVSRPQQEDVVREPWNAIPQMSALESGIEYPGMQYEISRLTTKIESPMPASKEARKVMFSVSALAAVLHDPAFGVMAGISGCEDCIAGARDGWGAYVKYMSNFKSAPYSYECYSNGSSADGKVWLSGNSGTALRQLSFGMSKDVIPRLGAFAGIGYGRYTTTWEDNQGQWILVKDNSAKGLLLEAGLSCSISTLNITAGITTTAFHYTNLFLGLGLRF